MKQFMIRHKTPVIIAAVVLLAAVCFSAGMLAKSSLAKSGNYISAEDAKTIALESVGVSPGKAAFTKAELDRDDMPPVYEIEFYTGVNEYEFEINALTGEVLEKKSEAIYSGSAAQTDSGQTPSQQSSETTAQAASPSQPPTSSASSANYIGIDKAKSIALDRAGVSASNATFVKAHLDSDDGAQIYEIEFIVQNIEYDYEIDAYTGEILESGTEQLATHHRQLHHNERHCWE